MHCSQWTVPTTKKREQTHKHKKKNIAANPAEMDVSIQTSVHRTHRSPKLQQKERQRQFSEKRSGRAAPSPDPPLSAETELQAFLAASRAAKPPPSKGFGGPACLFRHRKKEEGALLAAFPGLTRPELGPSAWASSHLAWTSETQQIWHSKVPRPQLCNPKLLEDLIASAQGQAMLVFSLRCSEASHISRACVLEA